MVRNTDFQTWYSLNSAAVVVGLASILSRRVEGAREATPCLRVYPQLIESGGDRGIFFRSVGACVPVNNPNESHCVTHKKA